MTSNEQQKMIDDMCFSFCSLFVLCDFLLLLPTSTTRNSSSSTDDVFTPISIIEEARAQLDDILDIALIES